MVDRHEARKLSFSIETTRCYITVEILRACTSPHNDFPPTVAEMFGVDTIPKPDGLWTLSQDVGTERNSNNLGPGSGVTDKCSMVFELRVLSDKESARLGLTEPLNYHILGLRFRGQRMASIVLSSVCGYSLPLVMPANHDTIRASRSRKGDFE
jgi:hypothetical protein